MDIIVRKVINKMKFEKTQTYGWEGAFRGMRNPKNSWHLSDSYFGLITDFSENDYEVADDWARFLFNDETALLRIDMSEYMEKHAVARLIGSPPG